MPAFWKRWMPGEKERLETHHTPKVSSQVTQTFPHLRKAPGQREAFLRTMGVFPSPRLSMGLITSFSHRAVACFRAKSSLPTHRVIKGSFQGSQGHLGGVQSKLRQTWIQSCISLMLGGCSRICLPSKERRVLGQRWP